MRIGEFLGACPPHDTLPHLFAGSWINHNFRIWIGHEEDNTAWDALHKTREYLQEHGDKQTGNRPTRNQRDRSPQPVSPSTGERDRVKGFPGLPASLSPFAQAWEEIYIAEGSDWFWWYGDEHSSAQDEVFDYLFRKHLQNVYLLLGDTPPPELSRPISRRTQRVIYTLPRAFLEVKIDGRHTFFEWFSAGRYACQNQRGTMAMVTRGPLKELYFGFTVRDLLIRVDFETPAALALADYGALRIGFIDPAGWELLIQHPGRPQQVVQYAAPRTRARGTGNCRGYRPDRGSIHPVRAAGREGGSGDPVLR